MELKIQCDLVEFCEIEDLGKGVCFYEKTTPAGYEPILFITITSEVYEFFNGWSKVGVLLT